MFFRLFLPLLVGVDVEEDGLRVVGESHAGVSESWASLNVFGDNVLHDVFVSDCDVSADAGFLSNPKQKASGTEFIFQEI